MRESTASPAPPVAQPVRLAALAVAALLLAMLGYRTIAAHPSFFVEDDAWFYMQIGYNLGTLGRATFDGIHATSGFHLAWAALLGCVAAFTSLFSSAKSLFLLSATAFYFLLGLVAVEYFGRTLMEKAALLFFVFYPGLLMESQLLALLLLVICYFFLEGRKSPLAYAAMALLPLVRIDAAVMLLPLLAYHLATREWERFAKSGLSLAAGVAVHFGAMLLAFGRLASVSSLMKAYCSSEMPLARILHTNVERYGRYELAVFGVMLVLALAAAAAARRQKPGQGLKILAVLAGPAAFVLVHLVANPIMRTWYFSPALFVFALVLIRTETKVVRVAFLVLVCALVVRETRNAYYFIRDDAATQPAEKNALFLADVRRIVPEGEPIYQIDGCGYTGFFSERPIVNGDGLMNTYDYLAKLEAGELGEYLRDNEIRYVITNSPLSGPDVVNYHGLVLPRSEADKVADSGNRHEFQSFVLWRVRDSYFTAASGGEALP